VRADQVFGGIVRPRTGSAGLGRRNLADDFIGGCRVRIHDDLHRDIQLIAIGFRRRLREDP
jgi:hypothetical protein